MSLFLHGRLAIFFLITLQQKTNGLSSPSSECKLSTSMSSSAFKDLNIDIPSMKKTIALGQVYQHKDFLNKEQIEYLLSDMNRLEQSNAFERSGLSNTNKGKNQNFGLQDRFTCETPWFRDSLLVNVVDTNVEEQNTNTIGTNETSTTTAINTGVKDMSSIKSTHDGRSNEFILDSIVHKLNDLRILLSTNLNRPTLTDPTLAHECYYSKSKMGALLPRHMDERHEETKGSRGWLLPSRRSISWLIYLSDENWDIDVNGGALRAFPQKKLLNVETSQNNESYEKGRIKTGCHDGNLQVGWLSIPSSSSSEVLPVFLDSWFKHVNAQTGEPEPHCVLYIPNTSLSSKDNHDTKYSDRILLTRPFTSDALVGITVADFIQNQAKLENNIASINSSQKGQQNNNGSTNLFLQPEYAKSFYLIEDRQLWSLEHDNHPPNSFVQDVSPELGSLVFFDSVSVPHEVMLVKKGTRAALAGWFHEETQPFPEDFYQ